MTPKFIAIEGPDGSGKTTLAKALSEYIGGNIMGCKHLVAPGTNTFGYQVRGWAKTGQFEGFKYSELMAFLFSHTTLVEMDITPALANGNSVVIDRYTISTIVYQGLTGKLNYKEMEAAVANLPVKLEPDLYIVLNAPTSVLVDRMRHRGPVEVGDPYEKRIGVLQAAYSIVDKLVNVPVHYIDTSCKTEAEVLEEAKKVVLDKCFVTE